MCIYLYIYIYIYACSGAERGVRNVLAGSAVSPEICRLIDR